MGEHDDRTPTGGGSKPSDDATRPSGDESRRTFLWALGATSAIAGVSGLAGAQETTTDGEGQETQTTTDGDGQAAQTTTETEATTILLGGRASYWLGLAPAPIEGVQNPTLQFRAGESYRVVWLNLDGEQHELVFADGDGNVVEATESATQAGATRSLEFESDESLAAYRCEYHPERMQGSVELGEGFETTVEEETTTDGGETTTASDGQGQGEVVDVAVGPEGQYLKFVPEEVEISVGDAVRWTAESEGHNVTAKSEASTKVDIPDGAEPFATYEGNRSFMVMQVGETFEYTFTVPGTYVYVCAPHADQGMVGRVIVSE